MIICHCTATSDRQLRALVEAGVRSVDELADACGAAARCGGCRPMVERVLARAAVDVSVRV